MDGKKKKKRRLGCERKFQAQETTEAKAQRQECKDARRGEDRNLEKVDYRA